MIQNSVVKDVCQVAKAMLRVSKLNATVVDCKNNPRIFYRETRVICTCYVVAIEAF